MATAPGIHASGSKVWIKHQEDWCRGEVLDVLGDGNTVLVRAELASGQSVDVKAAIQDCPLQNPDSNGVEVGAGPPHLARAGSRYSARGRPSRARPPRRT